MKAGPGPQEIDVDNSKKKPESFDLITRMIGHESFNEGSFTVLLGPRRTLKTELCLDFLRGQSLNNEKKDSLLVTLLDNQGTVPTQLKKMCERFGIEESEKQRIVTLTKCKKTVECCADCFYNIYSFYFRPGCVTPEEFMYWLDKRYQKRPFHRLVFWDLTQMESRFPLLASDGLFLPLLIDWLQNSKKPNGKENKKITSLFMGSPNTQIGRIASAIADNVIFTWRDSECKKNGEGANELVDKGDKKCDGVAIYIDRAQGTSSGGTLCWISDDEEERQEKFRFQRDRKDLSLAELMIDKIQAMQGFDILKN